MEDLAAVLAACEATSEPGSFVLWDAGAFDSTLRSVSSIGTALLLLDRLLTPATTARGQSADGGPLEAVADLQARLLSAEAILASSAVCWFVAGSSPASKLAVRRATAGLGLWEIPVSRVVEQEDDESSLDRTFADAWPAVREEIREEMRWVEEAPGGYLLRIRLPMVDRDSLRVGRAGANLVLAVDQRRRVLRLPAALQRCLIDGADLVDGLLTVRLLPNPLAWPAGASAESGGLG